MARACTVALGGTATDRTCASLFDLLRTPPVRSGPCTLPAEVYVCVEGKPITPSLSTQHRRSRVDGAFAMPSGELVCVGDRLGSADQYQQGAGTYAHRGFLYASRVGVQSVDAQAGQAPTVSVTPVGGTTTALVPSTGDLVYARVTRVERERVLLRILVVNGAALAAEFGGVLRLQHVRATQADQVVLPDAFRPGDVVRARVLSLGDARSFFLTTAQEALGVVAAKGPAGVLMVPKSWEEMECPVTGVVEKRKVADPRTLTNNATPAAGQTA